ncbi:MAG: stage III sporulation protein AF [Lachnospiraceae bacterium]|nr:stage III sporulation protein AF [Lachnospiraceae bacterium]
MEGIMSWVKSGLLFTILASVILMLSPNKSYMKHISLVVGLLFILVMVHPIMSFFNLDSKVYVSYLENFLKMERMQENMSENHIAMYEESVALQLTASLKESGYNVDEIKVKAENDGSVREIRLSFVSAIDNLEQIEVYLHRLFGEEVKIVYGYG